MKSLGHSIRSRRGFSLVELLIVVALIGILAGIAIPYYQEYVAKANRAAAKQFLLSVANRQEQHLLDNRSYASSLASLGIAPPPELSGKYACELRNVTASPPAYEAVCAAQGSQLGDGDLKIDQTGARTPASKW